MARSNNFSQLTRKTVLRNADGSAIKCSFPGCKCNATDVHHSVYVSKGGDNTVDNAQPMCKTHHIQLHSVRGDFRRWGSNGGKKTHATINVNALKNLPQFRGEMGEVRLQAYIAKKQLELGMVA